MKESRVTYRRRPQPDDRQALQRLVAATGVFNAAERRVALELFDERLRRGSRSGYAFWFADHGGQLGGYAAFGSTPLTQASYDLYWIVVNPACQGRGIGQRLLKLVEQDVVAKGGAQLYIETSSRADYRRTRRFYREAGYRQVGQLRNFYAPGDHKVMFCKVLRSAPQRRRGSLSEALRDPKEIL